jgi:hypothetical protein
MNHPNKNFISNVLYLYLLKPESNGRRKKKAERSTKTNDFRFISIGNSFS